MKFLFTLLLGLPCLCSFSQKPQKTPPNIIYILVDDLGYGDVGVFYQNLRKQQNKKSLPYLSTPYLDEMAKNGAVFTNSYCNAPVCVASRSSFLTGLTQGHANVRNNDFDAAISDNYTIANVLQQAGYATIAIGKWGLQGLTKDWPSHPLKRGFGEYFGYIRHSDGHEHYPKEGLYRKSKEVYENHTNITPQLDKCYTGDLWTARAKKWIVDYHTTKKKAIPFFMFLAYDTPHAVLELPTQAYPKGKGLKGGVQWLGTPGEMINTAQGTIDSYYYPEYKNATYDHDNDPATAEVPWPDVYKRYASVVRRLDEEVGDLLQLLKDLHIDENTLVVFTSDNGPSQESYLKEAYSPEFFRGYGPFDGIKRDTWEGGLREPAIAHWPAGIKAGSRITTPTLASDWLPTFLDAAGWAPPAKADGISLLPALKGPWSPERTLYIEYAQEGKTPEYPDFDTAHQGRKRGEMQWLRSNNHVGVRYNILQGNEDFEIYDIEKDPGQRTNLAARMPVLQNKFKAAALQMRLPEARAKRPYDNELIPPVKDITAKKAEWKVYGVQKGEWIPQTRGLQPLKKGLTNAISLDALPAVPVNGCASFSGYIDVPQDGRYTFYLSASGKAFLRLHEIAVIDADYDYTPGAEKTQQLFLKAGRHPFILYYKKTVQGKGSIDLSWSSDQFPKKSLSF